MGLSTATLGDIRLPPIRIASMASGMPCPRIFSDPNRAISPMTKPPRTGAITIQAEGDRFSSERLTMSKRPNQTRLVVRVIRRISSHAAPAPPLPTTRAMAASINRRRSAVKSPSAFLPTSGATGLGRPASAVFVVMTGSPHGSCGSANMSYYDIFQEGANA
jgi:hypothetical protein